jgi:hypothetical protein
VAARCSAAIVIFENGRNRHGRQTSAGQHPAWGREHAGGPARWNSTRYSKVPLAIGLAWAARWRRDSRSHSPQRRMSAGVMAAKGISSTESTSICTDRPGVGLPA